MQIAVQRKRPRRYTGVLQHFHNYEHDPQGLNHCKSNGQYTYVIQHVNGKHKISAKVAIGHGRGGKPQMFRFKERLGDGYDMASGVKTSRCSGRIMNRSGKVTTQKRRQII